MMSTPPIAVAGCRPAPGVPALARPVHRLVLALGACAVAASACTARQPQSPTPPPTPPQQAPASDPAADAWADDAELDEDEAEPRKTNVTFTAAFLDAPAGFTPGATLTLALRYAIAPGWHVYWPGLNDTGYPPKWTLRLPDGLEPAGDPQWPAPTRYISPGDILDHVHERELVVLLPLRLSESAQPGARTIHIESDWLVCKDACIAEQGQWTVSLRVIAPAGADNAADTSTGPDADLLAAAQRTRARLPRDWSALAQENSGAQATAAASADAPRTGTLHIDVPGAEGLSFFPSRTSAEVSDLLAQGEAQGSTLRVSLKQLTPQSRVRGIVEVRRPAGAAPGPVTWYTIDIPVASAGT